MFARIRLCAGHSIEAVGWQGDFRVRSSRASSQRLPLHCSPSNQTHSPPQRKPRPGGCSLTEGAPTAGGISSKTSSTPAGRSRTAHSAESIMERATTKRVTCWSGSDRTVKLACLGSHVKNDAGSLVRLVPRGDKLSSCLFVATRFHRVEGMCKLKTCTHKRASCRISTFKTCCHKRWLRAGFQTEPSVHPSRYSRPRNRSASGAFGKAIAAASHSSFRPARCAMLPRWLASVSGPL